MPEVIWGGLTYAEAIAFLRKKASVTTAHWDEMLGASHTKAFTVAGAMQQDLLTDLRTAAQEAIDNGTTITEFRKSFDETVKKHGWNYRGARGWRTSVIFDTNIRTAHAAGKWHKIQETKKERPYLQYVTVGDDRVRDLHQSWDGIIRPADDSFWDTHYPPNGWGCRCTVRTLNKSQAKKLGISKKQKIEKSERVNIQTGEIYGDVTVGIDTGWDYNVGKDFFKN